MATIGELAALEILDSRGRPTVQAICHLTNGASGAASVPSGASTGAAEALELRDGDPRRYGGFGCRRAVASILGEIGSVVVGPEIASQVQLDQLLVRLDGTQNKSRLGANAILAVSLAFARACAAERGAMLYEHFAGLLEQRPRWLPRPTINLFSGGKHAGGQVAIQDVLIVPLAAATMDEALSQTAAVFQAATRLCAAKYQARALVADEGGLAPPFASAESMLTDAVEAIREAGFQPGREVALAVDVAASHFFEGAAYHLDGHAFDRDAMIQHVAGWLERYPIVSIEDALSEDDWEGWPRLREAVGNRALVLGDDFLCTNPGRIRRAIAAKAANALLLKVNQIGTLSEAAEALRLARQAGWHVTISARSGETEDNWLADLAVGWSADHIKIGSITRSERLAKYNRLLAIEAETRFPVATGKITPEP